MQKIIKEAKGEKGISMMSLIVTVMVMVIITSMLVYNTTDSINQKKVKDMYNDIELLEDRVSSYYVQYGKIPALQQITVSSIDSSQINPNDGTVYRLLDLEAMENITLTKGREYQQAKAGGNFSDIYVINEQSHEIYYLKGVTYKDKTYYRIPGTYTKVDI